LCLVNLFSRTRQVEFIIPANIDFPDKLTFGKDGERPVDSCPGNRPVDLTGPVEELLRGEMILLVEGRLENGQPLGCDSQALLAEIGAERLLG
jgi:hypothetical protein